MCLGLGFSIFHNLVSKVLAKKAILLTQYVGFLLKDGLGLSLGHYNVQGVSVSEGVGINFFK